MRHSAARDALKGELPLAPLLPIGATNDLFAK